MIANYPSASVSPVSPASHALVRATADLEQIRADFRALHAVLDDKNRLLPSVGSKWNLGAVLTHVVMSLETTCPMFVDSAVANKAKAYPALFETRFGNWISFKLSQNRAAKLSLSAISAGYDVAHDKFIARLAKLNEQQWQSATRLPPPCSHVYTISEFVAQEMPAHFAIHRKEILDTLSQK